MKSVLDFFHSTVGLPWAWAIIAVTIIVRICLVPLAVRQIHSMQALQVHAPEMKEIQRKYKGDRQKQSEELRSSTRRTTSTRRRRACRCSRSCPCSSRSI